MSFSSHHRSILDAVLDNPLSYLEIGKPSHEPLMYDVWDDLDAPKNPSSAIVAPVDSLETRPFVFRDQYGVIVPWPNWPLRTLTSTPGLRFLHAPSLTRNVPGYKASSDIISSISYQPLVDQITLSAEQHDYFNWLFMSDDFENARGCPGPAFPLEIIINFKYPFLLNRINVAFPFNKRLLYGEEFYSSYDGSQPFPSPDLSLSMSLRIRNFITVNSLNQYLFNYSSMFAYDSLAGLSFDLNASVDSNGDVPYSVAHFARRGDIPDRESASNHYGLCSSIKLYVNTADFVFAGSIWFSEAVNII